MAKEDVCVTRLLKQQIVLPENSSLSSISLAYMSLVPPILEYGASCWDKFGDGQMNASGRVQKKVAIFAHHTNGFVWETLAPRRKVARVCALFKAYTREGAW